MNGAEHYRRAEALLASCQAPGAEDVDDEGRVVESYPGLEEVDGEPEDCVSHALAAAQVHATLALVAAHRGPSDAAWIETLS